jgi:hypothetical protein
VLANTQYSPNMDTKKPWPEHIPRCNRCIHYFITHDVNFPYGCNAMDFKSARQPILDVIASSGQPCLYFQEKPGNPRQR